MDLPKIKLGGKEVSRLICGGNPIGGWSHMGMEKDAEMVKYYTMENIHKLLAECEKNGINTIQTRGDWLFFRIMLEYWEKGGKIQWIGQTASELKDLTVNIKQIKTYNPVAVYHHGTDTDNRYHEGKLDEVADIIKCIKDNGMTAGLGTHIPEVIEYAEEKGWETDFYMGCFYNLARKKKPVQAALVGKEKDNVEEVYVKEDPDRMTAVMRAVNKPCLGFKILAAGRSCGSEDEVKKAFKYAFDNLKKEDAVVVGMYQKFSNQVMENAEIVRELLRGN